MEIRLFEEFLKNSYYTPIKIFQDKPICYFDDPLIMLSITCTLFYIAFHINYVSRLIVIIHFQRITFQLLSIICKSSHRARAVWLSIIEWKIVKKGWREERKIACALLIENGLSPTCCFFNHLHFLLI